MFFGKKDELFFSKKIDKKMKGKTQKEIDL